MLSIDADNKSVSVKDLASGEVFVDHYDKLIIATGARAITPPIPGREQAHSYNFV